MIRSAHKPLAALAAVLVAVSMAACSSSSNGGGGGGGGLPSTITIPSLTDLTGTSAFAGIAGEKGTQLAVSQINSQHYLGANVTLEVKTEDTATNPQTAASGFTEAAANSNIPAVLATITSSESVAIAPIAMKSKLAAVFTESGATGTVLGAYTYRLTAPATTYTENVLKPYFLAHKVKKISVVYASDNPTLAQLAQKVVPQMSKDLGLSVASSTGLPSTTVDFSAPVSKITSENPDLVLLLLVGPQYATIIKQLRQNGYKGLFAANQAAGTGNLKAAGNAGAGVVYPIDFFYQSTDPSTQKFVAAYKAKYDGANPTNYPAERYDALWFIARALKEAGTTDRAAVQKAMDKVAQHGFGGAMGELTFDNRDLRVPGVLVEWNGEQEVLAKT